MSENALLDQQPAVEPPAEPYKMPLPQPDSMVRWYANGDPNNKPRAAYVLDVFPMTNMVRLHVPSEALAPIKTPMHVNDPRVVAQPNSVRIESRGTWDFSSEHYRREAWENELKTEIAEIKAMVAELMGPLKLRKKPE